jgi:hypothetical protein
MLCKNCQTACQKWGKDRRGNQRFKVQVIVSRTATEAARRNATADGSRRICTSHIERQNLTMRMQIRRLTRLTNGYSKKLENLWAALCLYFAHYNFLPHPFQLARHARDGSGHYGCGAYGNLSLIGSNALTGERKQ